MTAANRIIFNTIVLGIKILITIVISLFTTRIVLGALGVVDFGIFTLVSGLILMLSFMKNAMATSTQRYLSFYMGTNDLEMQKNVFWNSMLFHFILGLLIFLILEIVALFLFDGFLNIPLDRIKAANFIFHFMAINVFFAILSVPFNGSLVAHENMIYISAVNIAEVLLKLGIAVFISHVNENRLELYGMLMGVVSFISFLAYMAYCMRTYLECRQLWSGKLDLPLIKELGTFAGWNLFGSACSLGRTQGLAVILNLFFGTVMNTSYGISNQIGAQMSNLSSTLLKSVNPQIMKKEGAGNRAQMLRISMMASKFGFFLVVIIAIPLFFEMEAILYRWLGKVPDFSIEFCKMILISASINQLTIGLQSALQATGRIKAYQSIVGGLLLSNLPIAYLLLSNGFEAYSVLVSYCFIELIACSIRIYFAKMYAGLNIKEYFNRVINKEVLPVILMVVICFVTTYYFNFEHRFIVTIILAAIVGMIAIYFIGLCQDEKIIISDLTNKLRKKTNLAGRDGFV